MKVDNLKQAHRILESFISNILLNNESKIYQICNEFRTKYDAINVCHRAKQEVEQLSINDKKEIIKSYYHKFKQSFEKLDNWKSKELKERFKFNQVVYALGPIHGLYYELEYFYNYYFLDEATALKQQVIYFRSKKSSVLFNQINHTITTVCDFLNPIITIEPFQYYKYFFDNIDFKERFSIKHNEVNKDTLNTLYIGLETIFNRDVKTKLYDLIRSFSGLPKTELNRILASTIELRGKLKNSCDEIPNEKQFDKKMQLLTKLLNNREKISPIEYQILISTFEGHLVAQLLNTCEIIIETLKELIQLKEELILSDSATKLQLNVQQNETEKYTTKHYVLTYLIECNAKGESYPIGQKKQLERIGNELMGSGKGNTFYKVFNKIINRYDINTENHLIEICGENWRTIIKTLSKEPEILETYLQKKHL